MHLSTTSSHMNNVMPNVTLDALGLNPVIETPWSGGTTHHPKTLVLKICNCKRTGTISHLFCFVPDVQPHGNYSEMIMYNMVKNNEPSFCRNLNISITWHSIYKNNEAACHSSGYSFQA